MLTGGKREREGKGENPFTSLPLHIGSLNGIPYAGWWRVRERKRKGGKLPFWRKGKRAFEIHKASFLYLEPQYK
jgi:hypothetical protein